ARGELGGDRAARDRLEKTLDDHQVVWCKTFVDDEQLTDLRPGLDAPVFDYVLVVDDQEEGALLVEAHCIPWNQQRVSLLQRRYTNPHEQSREHSAIRVSKDTAQLQRPRCRRDVDGSKVQASLMRIAVLTGKAKIHRYVTLLYWRASGWFFTLDDAQQITRV